MCYRGTIFEVNKDMFSKEGMNSRKEEQEMEETVKDVNGQILREGEEVKMS